MDAEIKKTILLPISHISISSANTEASQVSYRIKDLNTCYFCCSYVTVLLVVYGLQVIQNQQLWFEAVSNEEFSWTCNSYCQTKSSGI